MLWLPEGPAASFPFVTLRAGGLLEPQARFLHSSGRCCKGNPNFHLLGAGEALSSEWHCVIRGGRKVGYLVGSAFPAWRLGGTNFSPTLFGSPFSVLL